MHIRKIEQEDIPYILPLLKQLWPQRQLDCSELERIFTRGIVSDERFYACAETDGVIVGFTSVLLRDSLWQQGVIAYGEVLVVAERVRGRGIGTLLIEAGIEWARSHGCKVFEMDSAFHREDAHSLYERLGFTKRGYVFSKDLA